MLIIVTHFHFPKAQFQLQPTTLQNMFSLSGRESNPPFVQAKAKADLISLCHEAAYVNKQSVSRYACCHKVVI